MADLVNIQDPVTLNVMSLGQQLTANSVPVTFPSDPQTIPVFLTASNYQTYRAAVSNLTPANSATDIFEIDGPSSGPFTVRITQLTISATQNASGWVNVLLQKRNTLNSGGTSTQPAIIQMDNGSSTSVSNVKAYTGNPTVGDLVGTVAAFKLWIPATTVAGNNPFEMTFGTRITQQIFLQTGESLVVNLGGHSVTGGSFDISVEWTEWY
jgi:hypothetical protein